MKKIIQIIEKIYKKNNKVQKTINLIICENFHFVVELLNKKSKKKSHIIIYFYILFFVFFLDILNYLLNNLGLFNFKNLISFL